MGKKSVCLAWQNYLMLFIILILGCKGDDKLCDEEGISTGDKVEIVVNVVSILKDDVSGRSEEDEHDGIDNLTLFVFGKGEDSPEFSIYIDFTDFSSSNKVDISRWNNDRIITILESTIYEKLDEERDIHVFVNTEDLSGLSLPELKKKLSLPITGKITYGERDYYMMHGLVEDHDFSRNGRAVVKLKRNVAQLDLRITTQDFSQSGNVLSFLPDGTSMRMRVMNVADRSYLMSGQEEIPEGLSYISYADEEFGDIERNGDKTSSFVGFYINENIVSGNEEDVLEDFVTSVVIQIPYYLEETGEIREDNYYKIFIHEGVPFSVVRNTIYRIAVDIKTLGGETDLTAKIIQGKLEVIDWNEADLESDMRQTYLTVEGTSIILQREWNFYYASNVLVNPLIPSSVNWLDASVTSENNILFSAVNGEDYTEPRIASVILEAHNLQKKITVKQEAIPAGRDGSIRLDKDTLYLYEDRRQEYVKLEVTPSDSRWKELSRKENIARWSSSTNEMKGNATLTFEQGNEYGNNNFQFLNIESLEYDDLFVGNLFLSGPKDTIRLPATGGTFVEGDITALGGNFSWKVLSTPEWITSTQVNEENDLILVSDADPNAGQQEREGKIRIAHINEGDYVKEINIKQSSDYYPLPEFDYLVINCRHVSLVEGEKRDLDIAVEFFGTGVEAIDYVGVGYGMASENVTELAHVKARTQLRYTEGGTSYNLLEHKSDGQERGFESAVAFMDIFNNPDRTLYDIIPRYIYLDIYANWFNSVDNRKPVNVEMTLYKGGTIKYDGNLKEYINPDAVTSYEEVLENIIVYTGSSKTAPFGLACLDHRNAYTYLATVKYDKMNRTATLIRRVP